VLLFVSPTTCIRCSPIASAPAPHRPYPPGDWNDLEIFRSGLKHELDEGERVEADDIYVGEAPEFVKCPNGFTRPEDEKAIRMRVDGRHETINKKIKHWNCLVNKFKGKGKDKIASHSDLFRACAVVTQVALELGFGELFEVGDGYDT
jgi:hypothetical protein